MSAKVREFSSPITILCSMESVMLLSQTLYQVKNLPPELDCSGMHERHQVQSFLSATRVDRSALLHGLCLNISIRGLLVRSSSRGSDVS